VVGKARGVLEKSEKAMHVTKKDADNEIGVVVKAMPIFCGVDKGVNRLVCSDSYSDEEADVVVFVEEVVFCLSR